MVPNVFDLFAGIGGLSLGASRAGFNVSAAVELENNAISMHKLNFPNSKHIHKDIMFLNGEQLLQLSGLCAENLTGIIGGPPCQGFSSIGHGNVDDNRNLLFIKFFQLVEELQPVFFVAENVPGIMNIKYTKIRTQAFKHVSDYTILPPIIINASEYGTPTSRKRIFFIGYKNDNRIHSISIEDIMNMKVNDYQKTNVRQAFEGLPEIIKYSDNCTGEKRLKQDYSSKNKAHIQSNFFYQRVVGMRPTAIGDQIYIDRYDRMHIVNGCLPTKHTSDVKKRFSLLQYGQRDNASKAIRLDPEKFCPTLRAGTGPEKGSYQAVRPIHYRYARVITPREAARLQGFPDWFKLPDTIWHGFRQVGNSVSPIVAELILSAIYQKLT